MCRSISRPRGELWFAPHPAACQSRHHRVSTGLFFLFGLKRSDRGGSEFPQVCVGPRIRPIDRRAWSESGEPLGQSGQLYSSIWREATEGFQQNFFSRADRHLAALLQSVYGGLPAICAVVYSSVCDMEGEAIHLNTRQSKESWRTTYSGAEPRP